ncbi:Stk1 family PASTA domain-containing Ser/Thr kinase [Corynebacterium gerontici]|uniref:non-specific serine/threonine protein kinase n=1 Tax=Corynebacterium gerontici TaxID=2079234 RepID=A0A3G6J6Y0_9CORY|nr:Stk1 family PASTA domain-containing Ser/Thr kinase [Corynebacterium gerontici]AZA11784.1 Serine/threonine-protein kinase PknL [Corynebacterium gerontici]
MAELNTGDLLDARYRIEAPIARGGMSTVYRCLDIRLGRLVAAKVMHQHFVDDPVFRQRFQREARSMAQLSHPCLVGVYDFSADHDEVFLIMELITGGTLRELLAERGPMPPHAATAVMRPVLTGLSVAHSAGMIHRDLKPDNVLINADHRVKLADFGLVRAASKAQATSNQIVGTVSYLSPEQVTGEELTPASDVYSAGIMLFELLTGTTPFGGDTQLAHAYARLDHDVPAPSSRIAGVPSLVDHLVATATARNPEDRFSDAEEFLQALEDVAAELALPAFKVPVPQDAAAHRASASMSAPIGPTDLLTTDLPREEDPTTIVNEPFHNYDATPQSDETSILPGGSVEEDLHTRQFEPVQPETAALDPQPPIAPLPAPVQQASPAYPQRPQEPAIRQPASSPPVTNRSPWKFAVWAILVLFITAGIAIGAWWFGSGRYGEIPQVLGMDQVNAAAVTQDAGFPSVVEQQYSNEPENAVIQTMPEVGSRAVKGDTITLVVSKGQPEVPAVPPSRTIADTTNVLRGVTLSVSGQEQEFHSSIPAGQVISTDPKAGTTVPANSQVRLKISKGPAPIKIPSVRGDSASDARTRLERAGLKVTEIEQFDAEVEGGDAIETDPPSGTAVPKDSTVTLKVSTAVEVPNVVGKSQQEAQRELAEAGVRIGRILTSTTLSGDRPDEVVAMSPSAGTLLDPATAEVDLELPGEVKVPSVLNKKLGDAIRILENAGFVVDVDSTNNAARVYSQSPRGGSAAPGSTIKLKVIGT